MSESSAQSGQKSSTQDRKTTGSQQGSQGRAGQAAGRDRRRINA